MIPTHAIGEQINTRDVLVKNLDSMIEFVSDKTIRFCPDQKCEVYKISNNHNDFTKYVFLKLFHSREYLSIEEYLKKESTFRNNTNKDEAVIRKSVEKYCIEQNKTPKCILAGMEKSLGITECWANYDEGYYCEVCEGKTKCRKLEVIQH